MKKYLLTLTLLFVLLAAEALPLQAQPGTDESLPPDALEELLAQVLPSFAYPGWEYSFSATPTRITLTVDEVQDFPIVSYTRSYSSESYDQDALYSLIDEEWLNILMQDYSRWDEKVRCFVDDRLVIEMTVTFEGLDYVAGYWVWQAEDSLMTVFAAYDLANQTRFDSMADSQFGEAARCPARQQQRDSR